MKNTKEIRDFNRLFNGQSTQDEWLIVKKLLNEDKLLCYQQIESAYD